MFPFFFDWTIILVLPAMALTVWAQLKVKKTYNRYREVGSRSGLTGAQVARRLLDQSGLNQVRVDKIEGALTDHYDPQKKVVRLSQPIYESNSLSAFAIAAHETGHAFQDQAGYAPMFIRARLVPGANLGSHLALPLFFIGMIFSASLGWLMDVGILFFAAAVVFHIVTLPVEFDASARAIRVLTTGGYLAPDEIGGAKKVLSAAAWTYVAAASVAVLTLLRLIILRQSRD
jgi:uncharacterized protein